jgi:hypothetical protein
MEKYEMIKLQSSHAQLDIPQARSFNGLKIDPSSPIATLTEPLYAKNPPKLAVIPAFSFSDLFLRLSHLYTRSAWNTTPAKVHPATEETEAQAEIS